MDSKEEVDVDNVEGDEVTSSVGTDTDYESEYTDESSEEKEELKDLHEELLVSRVTVTGLLEFDAMARLNDCVESYNSDTDPIYETGDELEDDSDMEEIDTDQALLKKLLDQKRDLDSANQKLLDQERDLDSANHFMQQLRDRLECPVCLDLPRSGPVPVCPNGHIVCGKCRTDLCPTCRVAMGNGTSLLAATVLNNSEHQCSYEDCKKNFSWGDLEKHEAVCEHRTVTCPQVNCTKEITVAKLVCHLMQSNSCCEENETPLEVLDGWNCVNYKLKIDESKSERLMNTFAYSGQTFAIYLVRSEGIFYFILVMFVSEIECFNYKFEMVVHDSRSDPKDTENAVRFQGSPQSIDMKKEEMNLYGTSEKFINKIMKSSTEESDFRLSFKVSVKENI